MLELSPTLQSVWRTYTSSIEPVRFFSSTARPTPKSIFPGSSLETRLSVDISSEKQGWKKNMLSVNWMDKQPGGIDAAH
jgi:hypothetical protein